MEVKEEDARICRLCGNSDNICIDVFSEDGASRLLRFKIHTKINILIQKDDGLPTKVCVKCIGALEFLCDFYEWCHKTQKNFDKRLRESTTNSVIQVSENESDKENISPEINTKRSLRNNCTDENSNKENDSESQNVLISQSEREIDLEAEVAVVENSTQPETPVNKEKLAHNFSKELFVSLRKEIFALGRNGFTVQNSETEREKSLVEKEVAGNLEKEETLQLKKEQDHSIEQNFEKEKAKNLKEKTVNLKEKKINLKEKKINLQEKKINLKEKKINLKEKKINLKEKKSNLKEIDNSKAKTNDNFKEANVEQEKTDKLKENTITTPLTQWLSGTSPMNRKRKADENPIRNEMVISRVSESKYSKISELMTDEQKEAIENYYRVDMSVVDEIKVAENMTIHTRNEIECKICNHKYNRMDKCQVHIWRHLEMKPYLCDACNFSTLTVSNIRCHIRKSHLKIKPYVCPLCQKQFTASTSLEEHLNTHTGAKPFNCDECNFSSASKQVLSYHKLTHKEQKDIECDVCGKTFYSKGRLRTHKFIHMKDTSFKCQYCSSYFLQKEALDKHYISSHVKDHQCNICNKLYKSKKALNNHQNVHLEAKFQCSLCPNRYKSHHILKEHVLKHGGIRKYKCEICEKTFAQQSHLAAHRAVHIGVRYECPGCKKGFNRHDNMKVHTKRCADFLRNPALKELLTANRKIKTESISSIDTTIDNMSISSKCSINSAKTNVSNEKKILAKVELNLDLENSDRESDSASVYLYSHQDNSRKTSEILHSYSVSDEDEDEDEEEENDTISRGNICITENILSPECF